MSDEMTADDVEQLRIRRIIKRVSEADLDFITPESISMHAWCSLEDARRAINAYFGDDRGGTEPIACD